jgi:hypothetical protein
MTTTDAAPPAAPEDDAPARRGEAAPRVWQRSWFPTAVAVTVVVLALAIPVLGAYRAPGAPMEEGKLLTAGELVLDGKIPHRDFEQFYGPADVWSVAAVLAVGGHHLGAERLLGTLYFAVLVGSIFVLTRRYGLVAATLAAIFAGYLLVPFGVHAYSWSAGVACGLAALAAALAASGEDGTRHRRLAFLAGALAGLALLYRADLVVALALAAAVLLPTFDRRRRLVAVAGAVVTGVVPYLIHIAMAGVGPVVQGMLTDTLRRLRPGRSLPVPPPAHLTAWLDQSAPTPPPSRIVPNTPGATQLRVFFWATAAALAVLLAVAVVVLLVRRAHRETPRLAAVGLFTVCLVPQMLQRADATHVRFVAFAALPLAPIWAVALWSMFDAKVPRAVAAPEAVLVAALLTVVFAPYYTARLASVDGRFGLGLRHVANVGAHGRHFPVIDPLRSDAQGVLDLVARIAPSHGTVFVGPQELRLANYSDSFLYWLLYPRLKPVSFYLESNPGIVNAPDSDLATDLRKADVAILSSEYDNWDEPNPSRKLGPSAPNRVIRDDFCQAGEVGRYKVYLPKGRCP